MEQKIELPVEKIMKGGSGKFKTHNLGGQAEMIRKVKNRCEWIAGLVINNQLHS